MVTRVIVGILAGVLLLLGVASGAAAAWGYLAVGTDGLVRIDAGTIEPGAASEAIVIDVDRFTVDVPYVGSLGDTTLSAASPVAGADPLFLGAAPTPDVDAYLVGMPYSAAFRAGDTWTVRDIPGNAPVTPTSTSAWIVQDTATQPAIAVPGSRPLSLVIVRPAGGPIGAVRLSIDFTVPDASSWLLGLAVAAVVLIVVGALLLFLALRRRRPRGKHALGAATGGDEAAVVDAAAVAVAPTVTDDSTTVLEPVQEVVVAADAEPVEEDVAEPAAPAADVEPSVAVSASDDTSELPAVVVEQPAAVGEPSATDEPDVADEAAASVAEPSAEDVPEPSAEDVPEPSAEDVPEPKSDDDA